MHNFVPSSRLSVIETRAKPLYYMLLAHSYLYMQGVPSQNVFFKRAKNVRKSIQKKDQEFLRGDRLNLVKDFFEELVEMVI